MKKQTLKLMLLLRRKKRIRKKISGTTERPRLSVFRSARHIYAQVIDDVKQHTLVAVSSFGKDDLERESGKKRGAASRANVANCKVLGQKLAAGVFGKRSEDGGFRSQWLQLSRSPKSSGRGHA